MSHVKPGRNSVVRLLPPKDSSGATLFEALERRQTIRALDPTPLHEQELSNLLWAACGVNRRPGPFALNGRTAASASNSQEIDLYVLMSDGAYLYDPESHQLVRHGVADLRIYGLNAGQRRNDAHAPVVLVYVADIHRLVHSRGFQEPRLHDPEGQKAYYFTDAALMAQNVYLFAAASDLGAWFHNCDPQALAQHLRLGAHQRALFAQSVGNPTAVQAHYADATAQASERPRYVG